MESSCAGTDIDFIFVLLTTQQDDTGYKSFKITFWVKTKNSEAA